MSILRIEHPVADYDRWKAAFDEKGPDLRARFGARRYQVLRPADDRGYVMIDVEFDGPKEAEAFLVAMRELWGTPGHDVDSDQQARMVEAVETEVLTPNSV